MKFDLEFLKNNPVFWSRLGFCYDPPLMNERGEPLVFTENFEKYLSTHRDFYRAGVKIHTSVLHAGWVGVDRYDYSLTDRVLDAVFSAGEDVLYLPRIKLNVPVDWCYENPEDVFVYYGGPETVEEIRALVGTEKHDYLGYESPCGYYRAGDYVDTRPNVGGMIARQSFSSEKWKRDANVALEKLIDHLESSPYADRIIGYHIAYGISGETVTWGRINHRFGDYGIENRRAFYRYGLQKYGTSEALSRAWCQEGVTEDTLVLPTPEERAGDAHSAEELLRTRAEDRIAIDYDLFTSDKNADALLSFAHTVKKKTGKLVGAFYGYVLFLENAAYSGHLALEKLLSSPDVDFFSSPKTYSRCGAGEPGGEMCPAQSINRKKLFLEELDNRTYLAIENEDDIKQGWVSANPNDSVTVMWRELAKNVSHGSGFWWMDLGGGWFASELLMKTVEKMLSAAERIRKIPQQSTSDMLIVFDERSFAYMRECHAFHHAYVRELIDNTAVSGVVFDVYRAADLAEIDLSRYKLIVFACNTYADSALRGLIANLPKDVTVKYSHIFGAWDESGLASMPLPECEVSDYGFPIPKGDSLKPDLSSAEIREMARRAGCHIYTDTEGVTLYSDNRFIGIFNAENTDGSVRLKKRGSYFDVVSGERFTDTDLVPLPTVKNGARLLIAEEN